MLIKPLNLRAPRHIIDEEDGTPAPIPDIEVELDTTEYDYVLVVPKTVGILTESFSNGVKVGSISITYPKPEVQEPTEEYDEDVQLYNAVIEKVNAKKYPSLELDVMKHGSFITVTIPQFSNVITYNVLSTVLVKVLRPQKSWLLIAPCSLNNNQTINKLVVHKLLVLPSLYDSIPFLQPPHSITGISGAVTSKLSLVQDSEAIILVLNSEGQSGFEISDNDSIVDAAYAVAELILQDLNQREEYLKKVSSTVRKFNGFSNSGMYI
ncbi:uncharacterized protein CANTADRAFT_89266 [Suhomyces tanzawaensis NRRL Y-17324]|uniref:Uncharacterized protein n=1 Tax=Suhomyces tanzawaensis NRRL Y-17324 TaxID=984487 RepID=A0A1E4SJE2_9ASCO|nr:uncharacterized protein CANTADRAFT_89266 [Suhomyces tanzawaensis NRRL Y-17324]ODV79623.1 hypothetical protein CANTADRAFT_89266 [Suhomyces tanzawaensis NRRL Y-17324]